MLCYIITFSYKLRVSNDYSKKFTVGCHSLLWFKFICICSGPHGHDHHGHGHGGVGFYGHLDLQAQGDTHLDGDWFDKRFSESYSHSHLELGYRMKSGFSINANIKLEGEASGHDHHGHGHGGEEHAGEEHA